MARSGRPEGRDGLDPLAGDEMQGGDLDLTALSRAIGRRKGWIILPTLLAFVLSIGVVSTLAPLYKGEVRILLEPRETAFTRPSGEGGGSPDARLVDDQAVRSQVEVITSLDLARAAAKELKLEERPDFTSKSLFGLAVDKVLALAGIAPSSEPTDQTLKAYFDAMTAYSIDKSRVIAIEFNARDPDFAAQAANTIADLYLSERRSSKREDTLGASQSLSPQIETLRARVRKAEDAVEVFRTTNGLFESQNNASLTTQQLGEINSQLTSARSLEAESSARAKLIRQMLADGRPVEVTDVTNNDLIRRLVESRITLQSQIAQESRTLLPAHPRMKELRAQLADLEGRIIAEAERTVRALENDAVIARSRVASLEAELDLQKRRAADANSQEVQLRALEREAKSERDLLESFLSRYREASARATFDSLPADARIVSRALPPSTPFFPRKGPIIVIATLAVLILSLVMVASAELLSGRALSPSGAGVQRGARPGDRPGRPVNEWAIPQVDAETEAAPPAAEAPIDPPDVEPELSPADRPVEPASAAVVATAPPATVAAADVAPPVSATEADEPPAAATAPLTPEAQPVAVELEAGPPVDPVASEPPVAAVTMPMAAAAPVPSSRFLFLGAGKSPGSLTAALAFARRAASRGHMAMLIDLSDSDYPGLSDVAAGRVDIGSVITADGAGPSVRIHRVSAGSAESRPDDLDLLVKALASRYGIIVMHANLATLPAPDFLPLGLALDATAVAADTTLLVTDPALEGEAVALFRQRLLDAGARLIVTGGGRREAA